MNQSEQTMLTFSTLIVSIWLCACVYIKSVRPTNFRVISLAAIAVAFFIESSSCRCSYNFIFSHRIALSRLHQRTHSQWDQLLSKILMSLSVNYNDMGNKKKYTHTIIASMPIWYPFEMYSWCHAWCHVLFLKGQIYFKFSKKKSSMKFVSLDSNDSIVINSFPAERNKLDNFQFISNCATHTQ